MKGHYFKRNCKCKIENCGCTWTYVVDIGKDPLTGERRQKWKGNFNTKQEAQIAVAELLSKVNKGTYFEESNILFKHFANDWLEHYINKTAPKPGTIRLRKQSINKLLEYFSNMKLKDITEEMYQAILDDLKDRGYAKSTIDGHHTTAKMIFKLAVNQKMINFNPTVNAYIKPDEEVIIEDDEEELPEYFEKNELVTFLKAVREYGLFMDYLVFLILSYTGMRIGELIALKWRNIDFKKKTISITKTYHNPDNNTKKYQLVPPKTKKSRRKIVIGDEIISELIKYKTEQEKLIKHFGDSYNNGDYIFANVNRHPGYPVTIKFLGTRMARILKKTDLNPNITPHSLRHTHTSLLAEAGVSLEEIMDRLGHSDDEVTRKVYLHVTTKMKTDAANKFSQLMGEIA